MTEITSERHAEETVSLGTYCSVCACMRVCDTGWRCVTVAYRVPEPRAKESSLIKVKRSDPTNLFSQNEFCIVSSPATTESMQLGFCIVSSPATESMQEVAARFAVTFYYFIFCSELKWKFIDGAITNTTWGRGARHPFLPSLPHSSLPRAFTVAGVMGSAMATSGRRRGEANRGRCADRVLAPGVAGNNCC